jgi:protein-L-isoaspartate(D-aspartate) O-methyltransferase
MNDTFKFQGLRRHLVKELESKGIQDKTVLDAIGKVQRHLFVLNGFEDLAYEDKALPILASQTISQPFTVAFQTQLLEPKKGEKVLEIGTGSGYQTAVLVECGFKVFTIERQRALFDKTKMLLNKLNYSSVKMFYGDGYAGNDAFAPYDKIIVTAGATEIPVALKQQLKIGGIMVIPVGETRQMMLKLIKISGTEFEICDHGIFNFVPLLKYKSEQLKT